MKQHLQTGRLGLDISMGLAAFPVNADIHKTDTAHVTYNYYYHPGDLARYYWLGDW